MTHNPWEQYALSVSLKLGSKHYPDDPEKTFRSIFETVARKEVEVARDQLIKDLERDKDAHEREADDLQDDLDRLMELAGVKRIDELETLIELATRLKELASVSAKPSPGQ